MIWNHYLLSLGHRKLCHFQWRIENWFWYRRTWTSLIFLISKQYFPFSGHSFIGLLTPEDVVNRFDIKISFRSFTENGIIFYAQGSKDNDFISLTILNGFVEFRYDLGSGTLLIRSNSKISMGQWHHLVARRYNQDGFLSLDASDKVTGKAVGSIKTLNVDQLAWIGGLDDGKLV